jgi:hypothetical protein
MKYYAKDPETGITVVYDPEEHADPLGFFYGLLVGGVISSFLWGLILYSLGVF